MKTDTATAPLDFVGSARREDALAAKRRHFATATRWAHRLPDAETEEDERRTRRLMMANIYAGLRCGMELTR